MEKVHTGSIRMEKGRKIKKTTSLFEKKEKLTNIVSQSFPL